MTNIQPMQPSQYANAITLLQKGACVVLPTETVYGLAARADNALAVSMIYDIKERTRDLPLSICVFSATQATQICHVSPLAQALMDVFWPGPLTLVLPQKKTANIAINVNEGLGSLGLRCPDIEWREGFLALGFDTPLALSSANISGDPSPKTASEAAESLQDDDLLILDGGFCASGEDSTVISVEGNRAKILRAGPIDAKDFRAFNIEWDVS